GGVRGSAAGQRRGHAVLDAGGLAGRGGRGAVRRRRRRGRRVDSALARRPLCARARGGISRRARELWVRISPRLARGADGTEPVARPRGRPAVSLKESVAVSSPQPLTGGPEIAGLMYHEVTDDPTSSGFQRPGALPYTLSRAAF